MNTEARLTFSAGLAFSTGIHGDDYDTFTLFETIARLTNLATKLMAHNQARFAIQPDPGFPVM
jgi:hypothetical protein